MATSSALAAAPPQTKRDMRDAYENVVSRHFTVEDLDGNRFYFHCD